MTPLLAVCGAFSGMLALTVLAIPGRPELGAAALLLAILAAGVATVVRPLALGLAVAGALFGMARAELPAAEPGLAVQAAALAGRTVTVSGAAVDDAKAVSGGYEVLLEPGPLHDAGGSALPAPGNLLVRARGQTAIGYGDRLEVTGRLRLPDERPGFDRRAYLAERQVRIELAATRVSSRPAVWSPAQLPSQLRARYRAAVEAVLPQPHAALLLGVVLGIRTGVPVRLEQALQATGLVHLLVLSGLKVAVFARLAGSALAPLLGRWSSVPVLALVALYALAGGATPAAVRAAAMGGLAVLGSRLGRPTHVWTSLAVVAAAMLGWHPELAWDVGFQLSFLGTAAIVLLTPALTARLGWLPGIVREPFAVTLAAQVGTLPLTAAGFHVLSPVAPVANALVLPLLPAMVGAGLLLAPLAAIPDLGRVLAIPLDALLAYLEQVAVLLAAFPLAAVPITTFPAWVGGAYYSALSGIGVAFRTAGSRRAVALALAAGVPLAIAGGEVIAWRAHPPAAAVLDVGDGQALLLTGPSGRVLVDGGPSPARLAAALGEQLPPWENRLAALVITSPALAHAGGLAGLDRTADEILLPATELAGSGWRSVAAEQAGRGATIVRIAAGARMVLAGMAVEVLAPEPGAPGDQPGAADLALRFVVPGGQAFCDLSDLDPDAQLLAAARLNGPCDYLLLPDGGRSAPAPELLAAAHPKVLLVSGTAPPARGLPAGNLRRTAQEGSIAVPLR
ncbi:MAG: ComEC/Rec2 family competence protein [Candidatus Dormibacteraeota bacterium]|nr:ComEC/Rec2 family competence protein [Candidatus Dormibacteraeota bacterium]